MLTRRAEDLTEKGLEGDAVKEYERGLKLLDAFEAFGGGWASYRDFFTVKIGK